ncbi:uncharacterized protein EV154DRAFT_575992, partial [Mucor mucedo]|uniref:uncharacterized protein n=1 Tax=Mucor mucedo TaxID=29922 RepID=UPI00221EC2A5
LQLVEFERCTFGTDFLCELSTSLPVKKPSLTFAHCSISPSFDNHTVIDMPYSSFGCLLLREKKTNPTAIEVYLKVAMDAQTFYYEFYGNNKIKSSTSIIFETFKNDFKKIIIEIRCFNIEKLVIELTVDIYSIGCLEGDSITFHYEENCKDTIVPDHFYSGW